MSTLTHPLAVASDGRDLFSASPWLFLPSGSPVAITEPKTPALLVGLLAPSSPALTEALAAHAAADALASTTDDALAVIAEHRAASAAWQASAGGSKPPKPVDTDGAASRLVALMRDRDAALSAGHRAARAVDAAAPAALREAPASLRAGLVDRLRSAHAAAVEAVSAASLAVAVLDDARTALGTLDVATARALGVPDGVALQVIGDRVPRVSTMPTASLALLTAEAVEAMAAPVPDAVAAYHESQRPRRTSDVVAVPAGFAGLS